MATDAQLRLELLRKLCKERGWTQRGNDHEPSPSELGRHIDRKPNYCNDLLKGTRSFGADIARYIEDKLSLPRFYFDGGVATFSDEATNAALMLDRVQDAKLRTRIYTMWSSMYDALMEQRANAESTPSNVAPHDEQMPKQAPAQATRRRLG